MGVLPKKFYNRNTLIVAQELLGCFLTSKSAGGPAGRCLITETEAYCGPADLASHASRGRTERNAVMFGPPGRIYVYLIYGMYHMLNIVTEREGYPAAVLIRGVLPFSRPRPRPRLPLIRGRRGSEAKAGEAVAKEYGGPGKLAKRLGIDKSFNGLPIYDKKTGLFIEGREQAISPRAIKRCPRIGVDYAGEYKDKPWRFRLDPRVCGQ